MSFDAGKARHRITFLAQTSVRTASGDTRDEWDAVHTVWAQKESLSGAEFVASQQRTATTTVRFRTRACSEMAGITPGHRITWTDRFTRRTLDLRSIREEPVGELVILADELVELAVKVVA